MKNLARSLVVLIALFSAVAVFAQETNYEVKSGTVVSVFNDQLVVRQANGETREVTVPAGFMFNVDGKEVGLADLKPGTHLTAVIKTTHTPEKVKTVTIKNGEVIRVVGSQLWVRTEGQTKSYTVPAGFKFMVDGNPVDVSELRKGSRLTAEIVYSSSKIVTTKEMKVGGSTPPPPVETAAAPAAAPAAEPTQMAAAEPAKLPKTGSSLTLIAIVGTMLLAAGIMLRK